MITYCGDCKQECGYTVLHNRRNQPVDVISDCCNDDVFTDKKCKHQLTVADVTGDRMDFDLRGRE